MTDMITSALLFAVVGVTASALILLGNKMYYGKLAPNSWCGVRTKTALTSTDNWYQIQKQCGTATIMLGVSYLDSALLFLIQSIFPKLISLFIPLFLFCVQSIAGIILIYMRSSLDTTHKENS